LDLIEFCQGYAKLSFWLTTGKALIMKASTLLKLIWLWPPYLGAGISVKAFSPDIRSITVELKLRFWNKNYFGTQFGGSLFSMTDPFYSIIFIEHFGKDYIIWDKSASIIFKSPGRGKVYTTIALSKETIADIKRQADTQDKVEPVFELEIVDEDNKIIAIVQKVLYIKKKQN
jgi:hypothetical protein